MELVHGLPQPINEHPTILTIGAFDGVHLGHRHLIGSAVRRAGAIGCQSAVLTFDPHPDLVLHPERQRLYLSSPEERIELIAGLGADLLIVVPFTRDITALGAAEFMHQIHKSVALCELWVGWDFALGRSREGTLERLREIGHKLGYGVHTVEAFTLDSGETVSSTRVRTALREGDVELATRLLGRPFSLRGPVALGDQRGRTIGFPTANIVAEEQYMLPADGVYVCRAKFSDQSYGAVTNVGMRPTFAGTRRTVETYLLDFAGDLYGESLQIEFLHRLRGEQKFDGISALVAQITTDVGAARSWLKSH